MTSHTVSNTPMIQAEHLTKVFRDFWRRPKVKAVRDVSLSVRSGEVFGLLGPNGSGKSTTLKMVLGLLHPTSGYLRVMGRSPREVKIKARIGYVPEESYLYPYLTCEETLDFYGTLFDLNAGERRRRIEQLLEMIGLQHARRRRVGEFSKGMARRVGLAQALINDPDLIILDEPTSGLDPLGCRQVKDLIRALARRGKTVVLSSHLLADVEDICDRVVILYNGQIQAQGPVNELLEERERYRLMLPAEVSSDVLGRVLAAVRAELGREPELDHPRRDLEQFFIEVVENARRHAQEASGVGPSPGVAAYLREPEPSAVGRPPSGEAAEAAEVEAARRAADEKLKKLL
jgi:ABC-2 type transport system ATP-binding protein